MHNFLSTTLTVFASFIHFFSKEYEEKYSFSLHMHYEGPLKGCCNSMLEEPRGKSSKPRHAPVTQMCHNGFVVSRNPLEHGHRKKNIRFCGEGILGYSLGFCSEIWKIFSVYSELGNVA